MQPRAGGHSYGNYGASGEFVDTSRADETGWGGRDGSFVVGLKHFNKITIDKKTMSQFPLHRWFGLG